MKIIIAGSRGFTNYDLVVESCDHIVKSGDEIVCGMAWGADMLGHKYAKEHKLKIHEFPADWNKHGKAAGYIRNHSMGDFADELIAFWDGISRGTADASDSICRGKYSSECGRCGCSRAQCSTLSSSL